MTKVNIDTDGRLVWTRVHREYFRDHPAEFDLRSIGKVFVAEYARFIAHKNEKLGSPDGWTKSAPCWLSKSQNVTACPSALAASQSEGLSGREAGISDLRRYGGRQLRQHDAPVRRGVFITPPMAALIALIGPSGVGKTSLARALRAAAPLRSAWNSTPNAPFRRSFRPNRVGRLPTSSIICCCAPSRNANCAAPLNPACWMAAWNRISTASRACSAPATRLSEAEFDLCRRAVSHHPRPPAAPRPGDCPARAARRNRTPPARARPHQPDPARRKQPCWPPTWKNGWLHCRSERVLRLDVSAARAGYSDLTLACSPRYAPAWGWMPALRDGIHPLKPPLEGALCNSHAP